MSVEEPAHPGAPVPSSPTRPWLKKLEPRTPWRGQHERQRGAEAGRTKPRVTKFWRDKLAEVPIATPP